MLNLRGLVAILAGKIVATVIRKLKLKGSTYLPGRVALHLYPQLIKHVAALIPCHIMVIGTNGKTTTSNLLGHLIEGCGKKIVNNKTGANLKCGITTALLNKISYLGKYKAIEYGIWEVDERAFPFLCQQIKPSYIIFLNLHRDQLDRYGELDSLLKIWQDCLKQISWQPKILLNANEKILLPLANIDNVNVHFYSLNSTTLNQENLYRSEIIGEIIEASGFKPSQIKILFQKGEIDLTVNLPGIYQLSNLVSAFSVYYFLNLPLEKIQNNLNNFLPSFGRTEIISYKNKDIITILIKNPNSANEVLQLLQKERIQNDILLLILNNHVIDGLDVSWIWDVDFEILSIIKNQFKKIYLTGVCAYDLALRLKYTGINEEKITINKNLNDIFNMILPTLQSRLFILPNYSGLLTLQDILIQRQIKQPYWK